MNNTKEIWKHWQPATITLSPRYNLEAIYDDASGIRFLLTEQGGNEKKILITFTAPVYSYRVTPETYTDAVLFRLNQHYGKEFYTTWTFFEIMNSKYVQELSDLSSGLITYSGKCKHFAIFTSETLLEFLTDEQPNFEYI